MASAEKQYVLVTGGAGYIGSHTCVELLKVLYDAPVCTISLALLAALFFPGPDTLQRSTYCIEAVTVFILDNDESFIIPSL